MLIDVIMASDNYGSASFFGMMGVTLSIVFANTGAAIGTAYSGIGIASLGILRPDMVVKSIVPVVMAGILGIYGLIVSVILIQKMDENLTLDVGFKFFASGLACGLSGLAAGYAIGYVGDSGVRAHGQQPQIFVGMILMLIFGEAIGLYGLIVAIILSQG